MLTTVFALSFYTVALVLVAGLAYRIWLYATTPAPLKNPTTPAPLTRGGVVVRMLGEVALFQSLFKANKWIWLFGWLFHVALAVVLLRHLRYFIAAVPTVVALVQPFGILAGFAMVAGLFALWGRRVIVPRIRYISGPSDHLMLFLLVAIGVSGLAMKFVARTDIDDLLLGMVDSAVANERPIGIFDSGFGGLTRRPIAHRPAPGRAPRVRRRHRSLSVRPEACRTSPVICRRDRRVPDHRGRLQACRRSLQHGSVGGPRRDLGALRRARRRRARAWHAGGAQATRNGRVGIIGTVGTIASGAYQRLAASTAPETEVVCAACPGFVEFVERGETASDRVQLVAVRLLAPLKEAREWTRCCSGALTIRFLRGRSRTSWAATWCSSRRPTRQLSTQLHSSSVRASGADKGPALATAGCRRATSTGSSRWGVAC